MNTSELSFDIVIVYDARLAHSAADSTYIETTPFASASAYYNCNDTYQYFITYCAELGLRAAFTTTSDVTGAGVFSSVWIFDQTWQRQIQAAHTQVVFDKFHSLMPRNHLAYTRLEADPTGVRLFHNAAMRALFDNKLATYQLFPSQSIPTVQLKSLRKTDIASAKKSLRQLCNEHGSNEDFGNDLILKDQFGIGGNNIFKISVAADWPDPKTVNAAIQFIVQPYIDASGFTVTQHAGSTDLRVIVFNNMIVQSYLRIAKTGEFRANAQQGGSLVYLALDQIPNDVLIMVKAIQKRLPDDTGLYTLDFIKSSRGQLYFIEGNNSPGLNWFDAEDEVRAKELIRLIVNNLNPKN